MHAMTEQNLINSFGGESQAHMRYLHFATIADKEKYPTVARIFRAIAHAEFIHAGDHYKELKHLNGGFTANAGATFGPGDTLKNLRLAAMGEEFEITEMYPVFIEVAKFQNEAGAKKTFEWAYKTEIEHKKLFDRAIAAVESKKDLNAGPIQVCEICGFTHEGEAGDKCPVCGAGKKAFKAFE